MAPSYRACGGARGGLRPTLLLERFVRRPHCRDRVGGQGLYSTLAACPPCRARMPDVPIVSLVLVDQHRRHHKEKGMRHSQRVLRVMRHLRLLSHALPLRILASIMASATPGCLWPSP
jgi:hypothetical protein